jgi:hypothetical protein
MSKSDQIDEIEQQLRNLQVSSQDTLIKSKHEKELHTRLKDLQNDSTQEFECQQAEVLDVIKHRSPIESVIVQV